LCIGVYLIRLYSSAFFDCFRSIGLLATKPVDDGYKSEYNANPVETIGNGVNDVLEGPLEAVYYRLKDALKVHG
jgi:hypothetical protein